MTDDRLQRWNDLLAFQAEEFSDSPVGDLSGDVEIDSTDSSIQKDLEEQRLKQKVQANDLRDKFYKLAAWLSCVTVGTSAVLVLAIGVFGREIHPAIAVGFISGLAIETVGVLAIMAGYLFPREVSAD